MNLHVCVCVCPDCVQYTGHWYAIKISCKMISPQHMHLHKLRPTTTQLQAIALFIPECLEVKNGLCAGGHEAMIPFQSTNQHGLHVSETITKIHPKQKQKSGHFELGPIKITPLDPKVCGVTCIFPTHSTPTVDIIYHPKLQA